MDDGILNWKHGSGRIKAHSASFFHFNWQTLIKEAWYSNYQLLERNDGQPYAVIENVQYFESLPKRGGNNDERFNFVTFLQVRAENVVELGNWVHRDGHIRLQHKSQNEILKLMATTVSTEIMNEIGNAQYFSILLDETSDIP